MTFDPGNRLIVAVDVPDRESAFDLVSRLDGEASWLKIGLQLFISEGPALVRRLVADHRIMLDLKLNDIPNTVKEAAKQCEGLGAELITVHANGGPAMLEAAVEGAGSAKVLCVTVLTSLSNKDLEAVGTNGELRYVMHKRVRLAEETGCAGVVASPLEADFIRRNLDKPDDFLIVTPGIRPAGAVIQDQKRVATPAEARQAGADLIVVGRPIRNAEDPGAAARAIVEDLA